MNVFAGIHIYQHEVDDAGRNVCQIKEMHQVRLGGIIFSDQEGRVRASPDTLYVRRNISGRSQSTQLRSPASWDLDEGDCRHPGSQRQYT